MTENLAGERILPGFYKLFFQQHVELQELGIAELLTAGEAEVLLEEAAPLAWIPLQLLQQLVQ